MKKAENEWGIEVVESAETESKKEIIKQVELGDQSLEDLMAQLKVLSLE